MGCGVVSLVEQQVPSAESLESRRKCAGCGVLFEPEDRRQRYHSPRCKERALSAKKRASRSTKGVVTQGKRVYRTVRGSTTFWFQILDVIHYFNLTLPQLVDGAATIHRRDWIRLFYRGEETDAALRAWERFKQAARGEDVFVDAAPNAPQGEHGTYMLADSAAGFVHVEIRKAYDGAFKFLGPPHPLGEEAEVELLEREAQRVDALIRFADVLNAVQEKRHAE
jgi:hypothetical protein